MQDKIKKEDESDKILLSTKQIEIDDARTLMKSKLSPEEQSKHQVVEEALALLAKHKIMAFIYADVPHIDQPKGIPCVHQYNTIGCLSEYDENGEFTEDFRERIGLFNSCMWDGLFTTVTVVGSNAIRYGIDKLDWRVKEDFSKVMYFFDSFVLDCINKYHKAVYDARNSEDLKPDEQ